MRSLLFAIMLFAQTPTPAQVQTGTIMGRLLALNGTPAVGVRVSAMPAAVPAKPSGTSNGNDAVLTSLTQTDAAGRYRLENLPAGRYYVLAGFVETPTYYPGVTATTTATSVAVAVRATVSGIDFQVARSSTGLTLSGRLKRDSNEGVGGLNIFLSGNDQYPNISSKPDGSFEFTKLRPGAYSISVSTPNFPPQQIVLVDKDISDMEFIIPWSVDVTGNVSVEGGGVRPNLTVTFAGGPRGISSTNARDSFRMTLPEGAYAVAANGIPSGFFLKSIKSGSIDLLTEPLKLSRTSSPPAIAITLGVSSPPPWVKLAGHVTGLPNPRTSETRLTLNGPISDSLSVALDADGSFAFAKLLPGNYSVNISPTPISIPPISIVMPNSDLNGVVISFPAIKEITGTISVEDGGPIPVMSLNLLGTFGFTTDASQPNLAQLLVGSTQPRNSVYLNINLQQDGTFKAPLPEGQYRITAMPQFRNASGSVYAVKAFTYGATDLTKDAVSVLATDTASISLTLGPTSPMVWSKVSGRVSGVDSSFLEANPVTVSLNASGLLTTLTSSVKPDGSFEFPKVYSGTYTARIASPVNSPNLPGGPLNFSAATATINASGTDITGLEIAVPRRKQVTGRVTLEGRGPVPLFTISLLPLASTPGSSALIMSISPRADGSFSLSIQEGERRVGVASNLPAGYAIKSLTYGATDLLKNPLNVAMADTAELHVTLTTPNLAPVRVSGRVIGVNDASFAGGPVNVSMTSTAYGQTVTAAVRTDGTFEFPTVFPGSFSMWAFGPAVLSAPNVTVNVASEDVRNVEIQVPSLKEITGHLIIEGGGPYPSIQLPMIRLNPTNGPTVPSGNRPTIRPDPNGTFRIGLPEGEIRINNFVGLPPGYTVKSLSYGSTDLLKNTFRVAATDTAEFQMTLVNTGIPVRVSGHVEGVDLNSLRENPVRIVMTNGAFVISPTTDVRPDGTFEILKVYPGTYRVSAATRDAQIQPFGIFAIVSDKEITNLVVTVPK